MGVKSLCSIRGGENLIGYRLFLLGNVLLSVLRSILNRPGNCFIALYVLLPTHAASFTISHKALWTLKRWIVCDVNGV